MRAGDSLDTRTEEARPRESPVADRDPGIVGLSPIAKLPAVVPPAQIAPGKRRRPWRAVMLLAVLIGGLGGGYWWLHRAPGLPHGITWGNGRLEADEVDIDTKFAGRIAKLLVDEGAMVKPGQVVAIMDTRDLQAQLKQYRQLVRQAQRMLEQVKANYASQQAVAKFDQQEVNRTTYTKSL